MPWEDLYPCALGPTSLLKKWVKQVGKRQENQSKSVLFTSNMANIVPDSQLEMPEDDAYRLTVRGGVPGEL